MPVTLLALLVPVERQAWAVTKSVPRYEMVDAKAELAKTTASDKATAIETEKRVKRFIKELPKKKVTNPLTGGPRM